MKQLNFLGGQAPTKNASASKRIQWKLFIDGASRNNPGRAGVGLYALKDGKFFFKKGFFVGIKTNNEAEYLALIIGLFLIKPQMAAKDVLHIVSDSQLLVRQIRGQYRVKKPELQRLYACAMHQLSELDYTINHVLRLDNKNADAMANAGIDRQIVPSSELVQFLAGHDIPL